jgi:hypothetical protein
MKYFLPVLLLLSLSVKAQLSCSGKITFNFSFTGGIQTWTVPAGITSITIKTQGASGGLAPGFANMAGGGAIMEADYTVSPGQVVTILVGGRGLNGDDAEAGGGGATGVYINGVLKLVAGGGGGEDNTGNGGNGQSGTSGSSTPNDNAGTAGCCLDLANNGQGGTAGAGGRHGEFSCNAACAHGGGGGGGLNSGGQGSGNVNAGRGGGQGNIAGAAGGLGATDDAAGVNGGWGWAGGGGADDRESGGGGGYSGGGGGPESFNPGGGGSFSSAVNRTASFTANGTGTTTALDGFVTICHNSTLPLTLQSFSGASSGRSNLIKWKTANEENIDMFIVERSANGINFSPIGQVSPVNNNSGSTYQWSDDNLGGISKYYYRLLIREHNGANRYSPIILIKENNRSESFTLYPNPATDQVFINSSSSIIKIEIVNIHGQVIYTSTTVNLANPIPVKNIPRGTYIIKAYTASGVNVKKFMKE